MERQLIVEALGQLAQRIDHVGSTAVPGLRAKPIVDIQISVKQLHPMDCYKLLLTEIGYHHVEHEDDVVCPYFHKPNIWPHDFHVHVVELGSTTEQRVLIFRDYLRNNRTTALEYEQLKRKLAKYYDVSDFESGQAYADAKSDFINRVVEQALRQGYK